MSDGVAAWHYDGHTAVRHRVATRFGSDELHIVETGESVAYARLRPSGDRATPAYGLIDRPGWRIAFIDPIDPALRALLPAQERHGGLMDRFGVWPTLAVGAVLAAVAIILFSLGSGAAARAIPIAWEIRMGEALSGRLETDACADPAGVAAVDHLVARLNPGQPIRIAVVNIPIVNAVTLPGRQIVLFRGLIDQARTADEVAGVLAHEMGHVERRDAMVALVRGYGLSLIMGGVDGGAIVQTLLANRYSRSAERGADAAALSLLTRAHISPAATAAFFDRLSRMEPAAPGFTTVVTLLSTHPLSGERRALFTEVPIEAATPALSRADWQALRRICGQSKAAVGR